MGDWTSVKSSVSRGSAMRKCLAPFFIGQLEGALDRYGPRFDVVLPDSLVSDAPGTMAAINSINQAIRGFVQETVAMNLKPLVVSGDCVSAIGCLAGLEGSSTRPYLLWFDAHGDFHTHDTTLSGHLGGMPLAMITGRGDLALLTGVALGVVPDRYVCHVGGRDLERGEIELLAESGIIRASRLVDALDWVPPQSPVWIHLDTDYLNPSDAPAMRYPALGGPSAVDVRRELDVLVRERSVVGMSVSAWAPHLDVDGRTARTCWQTLSGVVTL